ncbi:hypothetical protein [Dethiosulfovibrio salsuginis]|uniref:Uncharacterized protein n=1 Tax=Dethiosulfovibrio salsuginis TaxID=561720 RepID=A0A1X7K867_9BACT|nr:hypothetical protein [Dethiosulfovibrio salsuginis]SMG36928.1 hypothetical protein SAMN06275492_12234 [Dethiosulfovibrio salsuginis]
MSLAIIKLIFKIIQLILEEGLSISQACFMCSEQASKLGLDTAETEKLVRDRLE